MGAPIRTSMRRPGEAGYTLVEIMVAVMIIGIVGSMTVFSVRSALPTMRGDAAMDQVLSAMRVGRDSAITQRRRVDVRFTLPQRIDLVRIDGNVERVLATTVFESSPQFMLTAGVPDTPDAYGNATAVSFGGAAVVRFNPDGTLTDGANVPLNGTVFLAQPNEARSARAVKVTGVTGRAQAYRWDGRAWQEQ